VDKEIDILAQSGY